MQRAKARLWTIWFWRTLLAFVVWTILIAGDRDGMIVGILVAAAIAALSCRFAPPSGPRLRPLALLTFVPFFIWRSLAGGVDVAWRAFQPTPSLSPRFIRYPMRRLDAGPPRLVFVLTVSLLPGTLGSRLVNDRLWVHCLDGRGAIEEDLAAVERRVAGLFRSDADGQTEDAP